MSAVWTTLAIMAIVNFAMKAAGPVALAHRGLPGKLAQFVGLLAPALLAGLVVTDTFGAGREIVIDARLAGVAAAAVAIAFRAPLLVVILVAPAAAALARALWS